MGHICWECEIEANYLRTLSSTEEEEEEEEIKV